MAVLRLKYNRNGKVKIINRWYVEFTDDKGISHRMPGYLDKDATKGLESDIKSLVTNLRAGLRAESELARQKLMGRDDKVKNSLIKIGLLEAGAVPRPELRPKDLFKILDEQEPPKEQKVTVPLCDMPTVPLPDCRISKKDMPSKPGVYFVWNDNRVVYIGKARNIKSRLPHGKARIGEMVSFIFTEDLFYTELLYIGIYKPERNGNWNGVI